LDTIVDELIGRETPPLSQNWIEIEEAVVLYRKYGNTLYRFGRALHKAGIVTIEIGPGGDDRLERIRQAEERLSKNVPSAPGVAPGSPRSPRFNNNPDVNAGTAKTTSAAATKKATNITTTTPAAVVDGPRSRLGKVKPPGTNHDSKSHAPSSSKSPKSKSSKDKK
jgi:hypothetical protein